MSNNKLEKCFFFHFWICLNEIFFHEDKKIFFNDINDAVMIGKTIYYYIDSIDLILHTHFIYIWKQFTKWTN